jgi:hypothetical protein
MYFTGMNTFRRSRMQDLGNMELVKPKKRALVLRQILIFLPKWQRAPPRSAASVSAVMPPSDDLLFVPVCHIGQFAGF